MGGKITQFLCDRRTVLWVGKLRHITWWMTNLAIVIKIMVSRYIDFSTDEWYFKCYLVLAVFFNIGYVMSLLCAKANGEKLPWSLWMSVIFVVNMLMLILEMSGDMDVSF